MGNEYCYHTRLSKDECIERLDNFLNVVKKDYNFLWEGNPSLIKKYEKNTVSDFEVDSDRQIYIHDLPCDMEGEFSSFGIVRNQGIFAFYLNSSRLTSQQSLITNGLTTYKKLKQQFDLSTKANFDSWAEAIKTKVNFILEFELKERMNSLESNLKKL